MQNEEFAETVREKISKIPNFPRSTVESLLKVWSVVTGRRKVRIENKINKIVDSAYNRHFLNSKNPLLDFPSKQEAKADGIILGEVLAGDQVLYPFELSTENLRESIFCASRAGHGKTSLVFHFVDQLIKHRIHFIIFDWKQDYRSLAMKYEDVLVIKWSDLAFNMLTNAPPGMDMHMWHRIVFDILAHSQGLLMATPSHILKALEEIYEEKKGEVTFKDLENYLKSQPTESRKENEYASIAENRLFNINHALDKVINVRHGFDIKQLFSQKGIIIEMYPLDFQIASFIIQCLIMWEFYRRLFNRVRINRKSALSDPYFLDNFTMLIMDEAHLTQNSGQERSLVSTELSPPPLTTFFSQARELLCGTFALTQFPHLLMSAFKDNAGTKVIGNVVESDLQRELASSMGLSKDDEKILGRVEKGIWIAIVAGRTKPFVLKTPEVDKGELVAEEELLARSKPLLSKLQMKRQEIESSMFVNVVNKKSSDSFHLPELPKEAWKVLDFVFADPFAYQKQIADALGLSAHAITDMKNILISKDLIRLAKFPVYIHNRVHYILTPKTLQIFKTLGKSPQRIAYHKYLSMTPNGYMHRYFQFLFVGLHRKLGWRGSVERDLPNGRRVDVFLQRPEDGKRKVIELETSTTDVLNKVRVVVDDYADEIVLLYKDEASARLARSKLEKEKDIPGDRIWVGLIRDYVEVISKIIKERESSGNQPKQGQSTHEINENGKQSGNDEEST